MNPSFAALGDWETSLQWAQALFNTLRALTTEDGKITRPPYARGEALAHELMASVARELKMEVDTDCAGNLHMTYRSARSSAKRWLTGSHLDSVPDGGNFDGAAGVIAGLTVVHALQHNQLSLDEDLTVIAFRAEEASSWFKGPHKSHFGSRALLGQLSDHEMDAAQSLQDNLSLRQKIKSAGFEPEHITSGRLHIDLSEVLGFVELHIEQGPVLVEHQLPVGIVSSIRGTVRARNACVQGEYAHSGAVPREYRHDALLAATDFVCQAEAQWATWLAAGCDMVFTVGKFSTETNVHSLTKVPGRVDFTVDVRSQDVELLHEAARLMHERANEISQRRKVTVQLGQLDIEPPALMDDRLQRRLHVVAQQLGIPTETIACGAGHDAANFVMAGVSSAMIFVRNDRGSHNRDEAMDIDDFGAGVRVLTGFFMNSSLH